jgi:hypothetical protein
VAVLMPLIFVLLVVCLALVLGYGLSLFEGWNDRGGHRVPPRVRKRKQATNSPSSRHLGE